ncbi:MAG: GatB/YqeY domain-containing protein [Acidobacteria bacterium]|nr:GatB/YqeY domain-containing protein [Acidobacteriota bacterium]
MSLMEQIVKDLTQAMKAKEQFRLDTLRMVKSALKNQEIDLGHPPSDAEAIKTLSTLVKQRRDAADQYVKGNRQDLADKELNEIKVIEAYLPAALSESEIETAVLKTIDEVGAKSPKDIGNVMKVVMGKFAGKTVDGKVVNAMVKKHLGV